MNRQVALVCRHAPNELWKKSDFTKSFEALVI